ncbi:MAG: magnesium/cobalt transporter CorA [Sulfurovaceae bacterium]|nr:magnesium/cobalt transporter CorA [Sulfurovaceae bacterium]MDD5548304.1 magnesium/cobalt transporter CorA [Sulfurovaceae bacterium]
MLKCYVKTGHRLEIIKSLEMLQEEKQQKNVVWIDMLRPTRKEVLEIEDMFGITFPTKQESEEIEISSRYWEENDRIEINSYFLISNESNPYNETVSFVLQKKLLFSIRYKELNTFDEFSKRFLSTPKEFKNGFEIFSQILDIRIDADADAIENLSKEVVKLRRHVFSDYTNEDEEILEKISIFEDLNMKIRENLTDKQRILTSLLKSTEYRLQTDDLLIMLKDIKSLIEHTDFNFDRLDYLQSIFLGMLNIEQNKTVKIFTIVNVIFLPPTLIASIYGMNFQFMPELGWKYGYAIAALLMILSSVTPLYIFKKKGWM